MKKEKRFEIVYQEGGFMGAKTIYVDKETGVNYLFIASGYAGGLTPLLDAEGKRCDHERNRRLIPSPGALPDAADKDRRDQMVTPVACFLYGSALSRW